MKFLFKLFMWFCTAVVLLVMCDVLLEDDTTTTTESQYEEPVAQQRPAQKQDKPAATTQKQNKPAASTQKQDKPATTTQKQDKPAATANRKVTAITGETYKSKLADYSASTTSAKKGVNAAVLIYLATDANCNKMLESMSTVANDVPNIDLYSINLVEGSALAKAYGLKTLPVLLVLRNGKVELHNGYLQTESLRSYLQQYN